MTTPTNPKATQTPEQEVEAALVRGGDGVWDLHGVGTIVRSGFAMSLAKRLTAALADVERLKKERDEAFTSICPLDTCTAADNLRTQLKAAQDERDAVQAACVVKNEALHRLRKCDCHVSREMAFRVGGWVPLHSTDCATHIIRDALSPNAGAPLLARLKEAEESSDVFQITIEEGVQQLAHMTAERDDLRARLAQAESDVQTQKKLREVVYDERNKIAAERDAALTRMERMAVNFARTLERELNAARAERNAYAAKIRTIWEESRKFAGVNPELSNWLVGIIGERP